MGEDSYSLDNNSMRINTKRAQNNINYAQRWLDRAVKDFNLFKKIVPFDKRTNKPVICSDPALAVYLLQQSIEKAVKAAAIASGQYRARNFIHYYRHNSLALIMNLNNKIVARIQAMDIGPVVKMMGIDLANGESKLDTLENQIMGVIPLLDKDGKKVDFRSESIRITTEVIDQTLDMIIRNRVLILDVIRTVFSVLPDLGIHKGRGTIEDPEAFLRSLTDLISSSNPNLRLPSEEQLKVPIELVKRMTSAGFKPVNEIQRTETIMNYLGVWAFSNALLFLTYFTFGHESTSRYPLKKRGDIEKGIIGCDDYNESLAIVNRIGRLGYVTSLTLNDMKSEIEAISVFFAAVEDKK